MSTRPAPVAVIAALTAALSFGAPPAFAESPTPSPSASASTSPSVTASATATPAPTTTPSPTASLSPSPAKSSPPSTSQRTTSLRQAPSALDPATTSPEAVQAAADAAAYLARQLEASGYVLQSFGYPDYGLTIDAILGLDSADVGQDAAATATAQVETNLGSYVGTAFGELYAGAVAKSLLLAVTQGQDPTSFGGLDLIALLKGREQADGRYTDDSQWGDFSNVLGQSIALIALSRAEGTYSTKALDFLLAQQCADGGFRLNHGADPCVSDPDATAFATQALLLLHRGTPETTKALDYLEALVGADGGVGGGTSTTAPNANSTGLVAQVLLEGGRTSAAARARGFLLSLQYGCTLPEALRGGIAYDATQFATQTKAGSGATVSDTDRRSTTQAIYGLSGVFLNSVTAAEDAPGVTPMDCSAPTISPTPTPTPRAPELPATGASGALPTAALGLFGVLAGLVLLAAGRPRYLRRHAARRH